MPTLGGLFNKHFFAYPIHFRAIDEGQLPGFGHRLRVIRRRLQLHQCNTFGQFQ